MYTLVRSCFRLIWAKANIHSDESGERQDEDLCAYELPRPVIGLHRCVLKIHKHKQCFQMKKEKRKKAPKLSLQKVAWAGKQTPTEAGDASLSCKLCILLDPCLVERIVALVIDSSSTVLPYSVNNYSCQIALYEQPSMYTHEYAMEGMLSNLLDPREGFSHKQWAEQHR